MSYWVWPVTQINWPTVKSKKVWAVNTKGKGSRVVKGDKIIFFVKGSRYFQGIFEVISDWHSPKTEWSDDSIVSESVSEIDLKEIQIGFASLKKLKDHLEFIDRKKNVGLSLRGTPMGPANSAKPISEQDYNLILEELKQVQEIPLEKESKDDIEIDEFIEISDWGFVKERIHELPPPNLKSLSSIISDVQDGKYAIPIFQREFNSKKHFKKNKKLYNPILNLELINNQIKKMNNQLLFQTLINIFRYIEIKSKLDVTEINLLYALDNKSFLNVRKFIIKDDEIYEKDLQESKNKKITDEEFNHDLSLFILLAFHHLLVKYLIKQNNKKMFESYDVDLLKEVDSFNVSIYNEIFPKFDDFVNIQVNIEKRLERLAQAK